MPVCLLIREKERQGVDLSEWGGGEDLGGARGNYIRSILYENNLFQKTS